MSRERLDRGRRAEDLAAAWLVARGHRVVARNLRLAAGEVDLVTRDGDVVVFVEVRSRSGSAFGSGVESVDRRKRRQIRRVASAWLAGRRMDGDDVRFDVIGVEFGPGEPRVEHVEDAFDLDDA